MSFEYSKVLSNSFEEVLSKIPEELKKEGFGVLTEIDVKETFKKKLDIDFRRYKILGACNPGFAYKALQIDEKIGVLLPCNIVLQEKEDGKILVSAVNPMESMKAVGNEKLSEVALEVSNKLKKVIDAL